MKRLIEYYHLAKPGIIYGNVLTTLAAFLFASKFQLTWPLFPATLFGIAFVIGSACVFNNYLDRDIDRLMARTKDRALVAGRISVASALTYGTVLGVLGFALLYFYVNAITAAVALFGWITYVVVYGWAKRRGTWGTLVGSIPGAVPIVVGYTAVVGHFDTAAAILFLVLVSWQMPHFYAIAMYRADDYAAANIPVLPAKKGARVAKIHIVAYQVLFLIIAPLLTVYGYAGRIYGGAVIVIGLYWLTAGVRGFSASDTPKWARKVFLSSLITLLAFCAVLSVAALIP